MDWTPIMAAIFAGLLSGGLWTGAAAVWRVKTQNRRDTADAAARAAEARKAEAEFSRAVTETAGGLVDDMRKRMDELSEDVAAHKIRLDRQQGDLDEARSTVARLHAAQAESQRQIVQLRAQLDAWMRYADDLLRGIGVLIAQLKEHGDNPRWVPGPRPGVAEQG